MKDTLSDCNSLPAETPPIRCARQDAPVNRLRASETDPRQLLVAAPRPSTRYVWYVVGLLSVVNIFSYMDRMALSVLIPLIKVDLELSDGQLGFLVGFAFFLFYAICGIPIARWADRGNRTNIIVITLTVWSVMTALGGAAQNFWHLLAARMGLGAGEAGCLPAGQSIISDYVPFERRPGAYAVHVFGMHAGTMFGLILASMLGALIGWRWTFVALGLPGIAVAVLVRWTLREPVRGSSDGIKDDRTDESLRETAGALWRCKTYRLVGAFFIANGFASMGLLQWWPSFYGRVFDVSLSSIGAYLGLAVGVGAGIGTIVGGLVTHNAAQRDPSLPFKMSAAAMGLAIPSALGTLLTSSVHGSILLAGSTILLASMPAGAVATALYSVVKPRMRATGSALITFCLSVLGFGFGPFCVGMLSDFLTPALGVQSLRYALLLPACVLSGSVLALYAVAKTLPDDLRAAGARF